MPFNLLSSLRYNRKSDLRKSNRRNGLRKALKLSVENLEGRRLLAADPILFGFNPTQTFQENTVNTEAQLIDASVTLVDDPSQVYTGGSVLLEYTTPASPAAQDQLTVIANPGMAGTADDITVVGSDISLDGTVIGSIDTTDNGQNGNDLKINFNSSATRFGVERVIESLAYGNTADLPSPNRTIQITVDDVTDGTSVPRSMVITVDAENETDFGDAAGFGGSNAQHTNAPTLTNLTGFPAAYFGAAFDAESTAQVNATADGDDNFGADDEDGISFDGVFAPGFTVPISVTTVRDADGATFSAWVDLDDSGTFSAAERLLTNEFIAGAGTSTDSYELIIPTTAVVNADIAVRFRVISGTGAVTSANGTLLTGEAEDYYVEMHSVDYGDAPAPYATLRGDNGPRHAIVPSLQAPNVYIGEAAIDNVSPTPDIIVDHDGPVGPDLGEGQTTAHFTTSAQADQGIRFDTPLAAGLPAQISILSGGAGGFLDGFIDFNNNGMFEPLTERITPLAGEALPGGGMIHTFTFNVPATAATGVTSQARFRVSSAGGLSATGQAQDGEVEDYSVDLIEPIDRTDAPVSYGMAAHDIAPVNSPVYLGQSVDAELLDNPSTFADGDDSTPPLSLMQDDEDGVSFDSAETVDVDPTAAVFEAPGLRLGTTQSVTITYTSAAPAKLNAWLDGGGTINGSFGAGEQVIDDVVLPAGTNQTMTITFDMPDAGTATGLSYMRFRMATDVADNVIGPTGDAPSFSDGEVEDYVVEILEARDWGDLDDSYKTLSDSSGAVHVYSGNFLGSAWDGELDGQPTSDADGDDTDTANPFDVDDDDGVVIDNGFLVRGGTAEDAFNTVTVTTTGTGDLYAWVDFDQSGTFEASELVINGAAAAGTHTITTPSSAELGSTGARFRMVDTGEGNPGPSGEAASGEVEDYIIDIYGTDFGDAPDDDMGIAMGSDGLVDYVVNRADNGPQHLIPAVSVLHLGATVDTETDGQPSSNADGDGADEDGVDFDFASNSNVTPIVVGRLDNTIEVTITDTEETGGFLTAWIDFDQNGVFANNGTERIFVNQPVVAGSNILTFDVPAGVSDYGDTFARFRLTPTASTPGQGDSDLLTRPIGGEVEDYKVYVWGADYGDLPVPYSTLVADNGAGHLVKAGTVGFGQTVDNGLFLGAPVTMTGGGIVDAEANGLPSAMADGDDGANLADEDGVTFDTPLAAGQPMLVTVWASAAGKIDAFFDFNADGDFDEPGEEVLNGQAVVAGANTLSVQVANLLAAAPGGEIASRFRISPVGSDDLGSTGLAFTEGEVEDYFVDVVAPRDFGDAPAAYPSASHTLVAGGLFPILGSSVDVDSGDFHDGTDESLAPNQATDDDTQGFTPNDDDGVAWTADAVRRGEEFTLNLYVEGSDNSALGGIVDAWIDFNGDGDFDDTIGGISERVISGQMVNGADTATIQVPNTANVVGTTFARVRVSSAGIATPGGLAADGEVEDYQIEILESYDYGDAPDAPFPTLIASGSARHQIQWTGNNAIRLGTSVDSELEGQPDFLAEGDDTDGNDDEDGVVFNDVLTRGLMSTIDVTVTDPAGGAVPYLHAWADWDASGVFGDSPGEQLTVPSGLDVTDMTMTGVQTHTLSFTVPAGATLGDTFMRFRLATDTNVSPSGDENDGEVEDYRVQIFDPVSISGRKFADPNVNGIRDPGELYLDGWQIFLEGDDGTSVSTFTTTIDSAPFGTIDPDTEVGIYEFTNLRPNTEYRLREVIDASAAFNNWVATAPVGTGGSGLLLELESNDSALTAQPVPANRFQLGHQPNVTASKVIPHVTISSDTTASNTDYYQFTVNSDDTRVILDIDQTGGSFDSFITVRNSSGVIVASNDNAAIDQGSDSALDSFLDIQLDAGDYTVEVRAAGALPGNIPGGTRYILQMSVDNAAYAVTLTPGMDGTDYDFGNRLREQDWGDAPSTYGGTLPFLPRHQITNLFLGSSVDSEVITQFSIGADGDDNNLLGLNPDSVPDDEDGISVASLVPGAISHPIQVTASQHGGKLDAWIDFNNDGDFDDTVDGISEKIFNSVLVLGGDNQLSFDVPSTLGATQLYGRFRLSTEGNLSPGGQAGSGEVEDYLINVASAPDLKFDFGTGSSPVEPGFNQVTSTTLYPGAGFGWVSSVGQTDRGAPTDLNRDLHFTADNTFRVNLPNGSYSVKATFGDNAFGHDDFDVFIEGNLVDTITTGAGSFSTRTYSITSTGGTLEFRLKDNGGADGNAVINSLEILPLASSFAYDFGTAGSPVGPGYQQVFGLDWDTGVVSGRDRALGDNLLRDLNFTTDGTIGFSVPNGTYTATARLGDASFAHDDMELWFENMVVGTNLDTAAGSFVTVTATVTVTDGEFTLRLRDLSVTGDKNAVINDLVLTPVPLNPGIVAEGEGGFAASVDSFFDTDDEDEDIEAMLASLMPII